MPPPILLIYYPGLEGYTFLNILTLILKYCVVLLNVLYYTRIPNLTLSEMCNRRLKQEIYVCISYPYVTKLLPIAKFVLESLLPVILSQVIPMTIFNTYEVAEVK